MILLQADTAPGVSTILFFGTLGMFVLAVLIVVFIVVHQRKVIGDLLRKITLLATRVKELEAQLSAGIKSNDIQQG